MRRFAFYQCGLESPSEQVYWFSNLKVIDLSLDPLLNCSMGKPELYR